MFLQFHEAQTFAIACLSHKGKRIGAWTDTPILYLFTGLRWDSFRLAPENCPFGEENSFFGPVYLNQERLGVLAAPRKVRSTFLIARLRSAGGFNL